MAAWRRTLIPVLMGVSGCGKSTVAKMAAGHPLTDDDRWPWLQRIADWIRTRTVAGRSGIVTCSALRRSYRDVLRDPEVVFVYLHGTREQIAARLAARHGHFMSAALLGSQFATLEPPGDDERAIRVDIGAPPSEQADQIVRLLGLP